MIVDIKDLDFKRLQLGRSYEETRYARGNILYRKGSVEIQKVELNEDNTYTIEANVKGSPHFILSKQNSIFFYLLKNIHSFISSLL